MDKELSHNEERLFELLESKNFDQLSATEQAFVLGQLSQEAYDLQRSILVEASENELEIPEVAPLVLPEKQKKAIVIPLYQAILAVASVVILFVLLWPSDKTVTKIVYQQATSKPQTITNIIHDTVFVANSGIATVKYMYDTIYENIVESVPIATQNRLLEAQAAFQLPALTSDLFRVNSLSLKDDSSLNVLSSGFHFLSER
ncbi:MAG: hypothetical protein RL264_679 [Bacteroidota bacterium]|jgi:hypothetical protein